MPTLLWGRRFRERPPPRRRRRPAAAFQPTPSKWERPPHTFAPTTCNRNPCSSKFTWYTFVPIFLFEQFTRFANAYFLLVRCPRLLARVGVDGNIRLLRSSFFCVVLVHAPTRRPLLVHTTQSTYMQVACLQTVPSITITNGLPTTFLPLSIVLSFDGIVTAREDYKRHQDDARANASKSE